MQSKASTVTNYLAEVPEERLPLLRKIRTLVRKIAPRAVESMRHGMPCYEVDGNPLCAFASQKGYIAFYLCDTTIMERFRTELAAADCGKSCIRFRKPDAVPLAVLERMILSKLQSSAAPGTSRRAARTQ